MIDSEMLPTLTFKLIVGTPAVCDDSQPVADPGFANGGGEAKVERRSGAECRRHEYRVAKGAEGGGVWGSPQ